MRLASSLDDQKRRGGGGWFHNFRVFSGTRIRRVFVFFSDTGSPKASNTSTMMFVILARPAGDVVVFNCIRESDNTP